jgi:hypothetical protein
LVTAVELQLRIATEIRPIGSPERITNTLNISTIKRFAAVYISLIVVGKHKCRTTNKDHGYERDKPRHGWEDVGLHFLLERDSEEKLL